MKQLTKQIIAFVLMVCMLSAIMAPTVLAEDGVLTYDLKSTARNDNPSAGYEMNDKVIYAGTNAKYMYLRTSDFFMYYSKVDNWYAVKVTGMNSSMYSFEIGVHSGHTSTTAVYLMTEIEFGDVTNNFTDANWVGDLPANATGKATTYSLGTKKTGASATTDNMYFVFKTTVAGNGRVLNIKMTPEEEPVSKVVNDTYYTVAEALAAGETNITLTGDVTENIVLTGGATLDLNGNTITGNVAVNNGQIVDNAGNGGIVGTLDATGNQWLSLYDGTAYKFFSYTKNSGVRAEEATDYGYSAYYYDVELSQAAYELIATGESGIDVEVVVSWTGEESGSKTLALNQDNVKQWAQAEIAGEEWGLKVQLTGVPEGVTGVTVDVTFTANGASIAF